MEADAYAFTDKTEFCRIFNRGLWYFFDHGFVIQLLSIGGEYHAVSDQVRFTRAEARVLKTYRSEEEWNACNKKDTTA